MNPSITLSARSGTTVVHEPFFWQQQTTSQLTGDALALVRRRRFRQHIERFEHAIGYAFTKLMRDGPMDALWSVGGTDHNRRLPGAHTAFFR